MVDTPATGETATPMAPSNAPSEPSTPAPVDNASDPIVEAAKKEAEQARLRANQLENELQKERQKREADEKAKLEANQEYKSLAEKLESELNQMKEAEAEKTRAATLAAETATVLSEYPEAVQKLAKVAGIGLTDDGPLAKTALKEKLDTLTAEVAASSPTAEVASNPGGNAPNATDADALTTRDPATGLSPLAVADARGSDDALKSYIRSHPSMVATLDKLRAQQRGESL